MLCVIYSLLDGFVIVWIFPDAPLIGQVHSVRDQPQRAASLSTSAQVSGTE